jgi:hypothetical protein
MVTLHEDVFTFMTISRGILLRMGNVLDKGRRENQNTHFMFSDFFPENRALFEIMSKNVVEPERQLMTTWRCVECWIIKATRVQAHDRACAPTHHPHARTHTWKYTVLLFHVKNGSSSAPQYRVIHTLPLFLPTHLHKHLIYFSSRNDHQSAAVQRLADLWEFQQLRVTVRREISNMTVMVRPGSEDAICQDLSFSRVLPHPSSGQLHLH